MLNHMEGGDYIVPSLRRFDIRMDGYRCANTLGLAPQFDACNHPASFVLFSETTCATTRPKVSYWGALTKHVKAALVVPSRFLLAYLYWCWLRPVTCQTAKFIMDMVLRVGLTRPVHPRIFNSDVADLAFARAEWRGISPTGNLKSFDCWVWCFQGSIYCLSTTLSNFTRSA